MAEMIDRLTAALSDRYRLERELGAGGMATVYLAHDLKHDRRVAIKVLRPELGVVIGAERFLSEIRTTANLQHPNLLPLFDSGSVYGPDKSGPYMFYVMPYIEGETLRPRLVREPQLPVDEALRLFHLLASALDFAHARGVIHRDLKPENILLQAGQPVIADFGIALAVSAAAGGRMTETGLSLGTPHYMSPEQAAGDRSVDARSDQYALAVLMYEMLTGEPPHTGATAQAVIARLMAEAPRSMRTVRPQLSPALDRAVLRGLAKAPADRFASCGALAAAASAPDAEPGRRRLPAALGMAAIVAVAIGSWWWSTQGRGAASPTAPAQSIAVMPFEIRTTDPDGDYISDGITQSISNSLARLPSLQVMSVSMGREYLRQGMTSQEAGARLGVATILTGQITHRGDSLSVDVELADVRQARLLWAQRFHRGLDGLLAIQDEIAREVSERLTSPSSADAQRLRGGSTDNPEAYQLYLKGMYFTARFTKEGFDRGRDFFQRALAMDSSYALAWDGLAFNYVTAADWFIPPKEAGPLAKSAARRALQIDSTLATARLTLGIVAHWYDWDWSAAEQAFQQVIASDPTNPRPQGYYAWFLVSMGRYDEAVAVGQRALQLNPVAVEASQMLGMVLVLARRYDEAITQLRAALELDPTYFYAENFLGRAYAQTNQMPEALAAYQRALDLDPENAENWSNIGHAHAVSGNPARAREIIADLEATATRTYVGPYNIALIHAGLGDTALALRWLERAHQDGSALPVLYMPNDARWDGFRTNARYVALLRRFGLPSRVID